MPSSKRLGVTREHRGFPAQRRPAYQYSFSVIEPYATLTRLLAAVAVRILRRMERE